MSSSRNFSDFIDAYFTYARDGFCPDLFHKWTGISLLAGALERKVWIAHDKGRQTFPNIYVFLISHPGLGKSSAMELGIRGLLRELTHDEGAINFLPNQATEAAFYQQMAQFKYFWHGDKKVPHSSGFLYLSEASNSLKEIVGGGSITASLTEFYDCPAVWAKRTVGAGELKIANVCCNALVGCTFDHLKELIPTKNIMGGFASRLLYIVHDEIMVRSPQWSSSPLAEENRLKLVEDLQEIHTLTGEFRSDNTFAQEWAKWFPENDHYVQSLKSGKMQALLARKSTNLMKLSMLCAVSESSELVLQKRHWDRAYEIFGQVQRKLSKVLTVAYDKKDPANVTSSVLQYVSEKGTDSSFAGARRHLVQMGVESHRIESTLNSMLTANLIAISNEGGKTHYKILVNPEDYL